VDRGELQVMLWRRLAVAPFSIAKCRAAADVARETACSLHHAAWNSCSEQPRTIGPQRPPQLTWGLQQRAATRWWWPTLRPARPPPSGPAATHEFSGEARSLRRGQEERAGLRRAGPVGQARLAGNTPVPRAARDGACRQLQLLRPAVSAACLVEVLLLLLVRNGPYAFEVLRAGRGDR
jgi:hypothetical protein